MPKADQTLDDILDPIAKGLTGTAPEPVPETDPKIILDHIAEVSQNARATWFGLLGLLAFVGVTLLGHKDADFFAYGAETQLPLVGITVPVNAFFYVAPMLVAGLYAYLQLYLMTLWDGLADAPARIDGQPLADRVFPWLISYAALWYRHRTRKDDCAAPRSLGLVVVAVSLALGPVFGIAVLALLWWRSMPAHDEWLTLWIGLNFWFAFLVGQTGFLTARARMAGATRESVAKAHWNRRVVGGIAAVILACLSWLRTEGGFENYADWIERNGDWIGSPQAATWLNANLPTTEAIADRTDLRWFRLYPADLVEADLTRKPNDWLPYDLWLEEFGERFRRRIGLKPAEEMASGQAAKFGAEVEARYREYIDQLDAPALAGADLRNARLVDAFLPGVDLRNAMLHGTDLLRAEMQGANLFRAGLDGASLEEVQAEWATFRSASMQGIELMQAGLLHADLQADLRDANLDGARMRGATLSHAKLDGAFLGEADLRQANLSRASLKGANLGAAQMQGANLSSATMQGATLIGAEMEETVLGDAKMQGADFGFAKMRGAVLRGAEMEGADFSEAQMQGANFFGATLRSADVRGVNLSGASLASADFTDVRNLTQARLEGAVGDKDTVLPRDAETGEQLYVWSCWETQPETFEQTMAALPEKLRERYRDEWLCNGRPRVKTGTPAPN